MTNSTTNQVNATMIYKRDPRQPMLLSRYTSILCPQALKELNCGWQGIFRRTILGLLPIGIIEEKFSHDEGRPTKELYSVCGLLLMMEFFGWSIEKARERFIFGLDVQYALNIENDGEMISERTLHRYIEWLRKKDFMKEAMNIVTDHLLHELNINITEQRLDSTHVFSNMAAWSRKKLIFNVIHCFLKQVRRHAQQDYHSLDKDLRERYEKNDGWIFAATSPMGLHRQGKIYSTEEQMGYDIEKLIEKFTNDPQFSHMTSYKNMLRVFHEQFVDNDGKAELNKHPGGKILLNPSDPDAEIGHKGVGYQVQIAETCSEENPVQMITTAIPQGGSESDMDALSDVINQLQKENHAPEKIYADAGYGSDKNFVKCADDGIKLLAPAPHQPEGRVGLDQCKFDENNRMIECPFGQKPLTNQVRFSIGLNVETNGENGNIPKKIRRVDEYRRAVFASNVCDECPLKDQCRSVKIGKNNRVFIYSSSDLRSLKRRQLEATDEFKKDYGHKRDPIEGLNGRLKQFTPLRRLRIRGKVAVHHSIFAILLMHNIMQAARYAKIQAGKPAQAAFFSIFPVKNSIFLEKAVFQAA